MVLNVTPQGIDAILQALEDQTYTINFTKTAYGNGDSCYTETVDEHGDTIIEWDENVDMGNTIVTVDGFIELDDEHHTIIHPEGSNYAEMKVLLSSAGESIDNAFRNTEIGLYISGYDGAPDVLFAYTHTDIDDARLIPGNNENFETTDTLRVYVGAVEDLSVVLAESNVYATVTALNEHKSDKNNPHEVTKAQVGLSNVDNTSDNDAAPQFTEASTLANIVSGETASTLWGKVKKAISSLISHLNNVANPHRVTYSQVGAAASLHYHSASQITSGVLSKERGGTGGNLGLVSSNFTGTYSQVIAEKYRSIRTLNIPAGVWIITLILYVDNWAANGDVEVMLTDTIFNNSTNVGGFYGYNYQEITLNDRDSFKRITVTFVCPSPNIYKYVTVCPSKTSKWSCDWYAVRLI